MGKSEKANKDISTHESFFFLKYKLNKKLFL